MPIYAVWWLKLVKNVALNWYADLSQNAPIKCFRNIKYFTKCVLRMLEN